MTTARALIASTLRLLRVLATGEPPTAAEADDALQTLNQLLDSWSNERLTIWTTERLDVPLIPGQAVYTWGASGQIAQPRPLQVEGAVLRLPEQDLEWPLEVWSEVEYAQIPQKGMTSLYPQGFSYEPSYPLGRLRLWPVPTEANTLGLWPWVALTRCASLDTVLTFPPGYERLLRTGLACELSSEYGMEVTPTLAAMYTESKANIKRQNVIVPTLGTDPAFTARQRGSWWVITGDYMRR